MRLSRTRNQPQTSLAYRLQLGLTLALAAGTIIAFIVYLILALNWRSQPFLGVMLNNSVSINRGLPTGEPWLGLEAGLTAGDHLLAINGIPLAAAPDDYATARSTLATIRSGLRVGDTVTVEYSRAGATFSAEYQTTAFPIGDFFAFFIVPYASGVIVLLFAFGILYYRRDQISALVAACFCFCLALFMAGLFDLGTTMQLGRFVLMAAALCGGFGIALGMLFPNRMTITYRFEWAHFIPILVTLLIGIGIILGYDRAAPSSGTHGSQSAIGTLIVGSFLMAMLVFNQRRLATTYRTRNQAGMLLLGYLLATVPAILWIVSQSLQFESMTIALETMMPFLVTPVIGIAIAIFQTPRMDSDVIASQGITYGILLAALIVGYFLLTLGAGLLFSQVVPNNPLMIAATLFVIAVLFIPVRSRVQSQIDKIYFRRRQRYEDMLESFTREIGTLTNNTLTLAAFRQVMDEALAPENTFLFLPSARGSGEFLAYGDPDPETDVVFSPGGGVVEMLRTQGGVHHLPPGAPLPRDLVIDRARLSILKTVVLCALRTGDTLNGIVSIGRARSGQPYTHEELRLIENVISGFSVAVERAQVIDSLERRVKELDVLSQVGQAVNFTIEFDDLLELISTRANRLIDSAHFYIALYEQAANTMYFAFYLENDERYPEQEGKRWRLSNDLFSEIVRTGQPRRVDDYVVATTEGGYELLFDNKNVHAWMGVPLIAGANILGTMAVAKAKPGDSYTADQLRIFSNIGALAATSIDKARLFSEANVRARQLSVLNDISQQLVLAEAGELETLLKLITSSAVEILNADAGSLLLADDESNDMIFRVAVGGTGSDLIGKRIPSTYGMVGEVVRTGKPVISNDIRQDTKWQGEVSSDGFRTQSILAVPLTAKDRIVGVLEVLNKKDMTTFVKEEAELLTTFAGQAAIAIENARLFQMTGSQLEKRLEELETLERIDFELNRTLDLQRVAEITVRWAVASSGATAGALGLVEGTPPMVNVLATYGYKPGELPEGTDGKKWPADRGIIKRVIRTLQPDLAPDVRIDPDYTPSLTGALSQMTLPMMSGGELIAMLVLETNKEPRFNLLDLTFVQRIAEHASVSVANAQLLRELQFAAETKSEFVGFAAHELKNPLASVKGYAGLLNNRSMLAQMSEEMRNDAITRILTNADRMESIINDLRDVAAIDANKLKMELQPISFYKVVEDTLMTFDQRLEEKDQKVQNLVSPDLPLVLGDHQRLLQVMTNLVSNAHKYSDEGKTITIRADVNRSFRTRQGQLLGAVLHVKVIDEGIGMDESDLSRIFREDYFRSDNEKARAQKGTGLGMMITQRFVEGHGGRIWVESQIGVGSVFQFVVPLAPDVPKPEEPVTGVQFEDYRAPTQHSNGRKTEPNMAAEHQPASD